MAQALGGSRADALPRAAAVECIHAASLIHDDFIDSDTERRGTAALWAELGARTAILVGDVLFAESLRAMVALGKEDGMAAAEAIAAMARGACREYVASSAAGYDRSIYLKTGFLFGVAAKLGAIAAAADQETVERAFVFGARLGEAYQIADDLCDVVEADEAEAAAPELYAVLARFGNGATAIEKVRPILDARMRREIAVRLASAHAAIVGFPSNGHFGLLCEVGPAIVAAQVAPVSFATGA